MSGVSTPSRRLSSTTTRVAPPSRRNAFSCSSAQIRELERNTSRRTDFAAVAQRQHEQPRAPVLAGLRVAHHRAVAVIDLRFFAGRGLDHHASFRRWRSAQLADEALDAVVAAGEAVVVHQVLPDGHGVAAARQRQLDDFAVRLAGAGRRTAARLRLRLWSRCRSAGFSAPGSVVTSMAGFAGGRSGPSRPAAAPRSRPLSDTRLAVSRRIRVACSMRRSDQPSRPSAMTCCFFSSLKTLLTLTEGNPPSGSMSWISLSRWPVFRCPSYGRFWVSTEGCTKKQYPCRRCSWGERAC